MIWLVVWNIFSFSHHIGNVIIPTDELHHFSRWLKHVIAPPPLNHYKIPLNHPIIQPVM